MKNLLTTLIALTLVIPLMGQVKTNFSDMTSSEVRQFLLNQDVSEPALKMTKKHNISRITSYGFMAVSLMFTIAAIDASNESGLAAPKFVTGFLAGTTGVIAGIYGFAASKRLKKAKDIYLNAGNNPVGYIDVQIRDEAEILNSITRYPKPH